MLFIILFALAALGIPLSYELYRRGHDNILARSGRELLATKILSSIVRRLDLTIGAKGAYALAFLASITAIIAATLIFRLVVAFLGFLPFFAHGRHPTPEGVDTFLTGTAAAFLTIMTALSTAVQQIIEHIIKKRIAWLDHATPDNPRNENRRASAIHFTTFTVGAVLSWSVGLKPLVYLGIRSEVAAGTILNALLAGVMISFGSSFFDEALGGLREWKKAQETAAKKG